MTSPPSLSHSSRLLPHSPPTVSLGSWGGHQVEPIDSEHPLPRLQAACLEKEESSHRFFKTLSAIISIAMGLLTAWRGASLHLLARALLGSAVAGATFHLTTVGFDRMRSHDYRYLSGLLSIPTHPFTSSILDFSSSLTPEATLLAYRTFNQTQLERIRSTLSF